MFLAQPPTASAASAFSLQSYLEKILGGRAPDDIAVVQLDDTRFRARIDTALLFDLFQLRPSEALSPKTTMMTITDAGDGSWRFSASDRLATGHVETLAEKATSTVFNTGKAEFSGLFDPNKGRTSYLALNYRDGLYEIDVPDSKIKYSFDTFGIKLEEASDREGRSRAKASFSSGRFSFDLREKPGTSLAHGKSANYSIAAEGLDYQSLKSQLRYGDAIDPHTSEGEPAYPLSATASMSRFDAKLEAENLASMEGVEGVYADWLQLKVSGRIPNAEAKSSLEFTVKGFEFVGPDAREYFLPVMPDTIKTRANLTGVDFRRLYLASNFASRIGKDNDLSYFDAGIVPENKVYLSNFSTLFSNENCRFTVTGNFTFNIETGFLDKADLTLETRDLDKIIKINRERAARDRRAGSLQFMLHFLKGASKSDGHDGLTWHIAIDGEQIHVNGQRVRG